LLRFSNNCGSLGWKGY